MTRKMNRHAISLASVVVTAWTATIAMAAPGLEDTFTISLEVAVSDGVPAAGAGNIEDPGSTDVYTISNVGVTDVWFHEDAGGCGIRWSCEAPDGTMLFDNNLICTGHPGDLEFDQDGDYTITVWGNGTTTGTYGFTVWESSKADLFGIGYESIISEDVPGTGAGNIEEPGAIDIYAFDATAGDVVYFDELAGGCGIHWECMAPDGTKLFENNLMCTGDPGTYTLDRTGQYLIQADGPSGGVGTYSFTLWTVEPADEFAIAIDDVVSDGVPGAGAGNLEEPGAIDIYTFAASDGQTVYFEELAGGCGIQWECIAPDGAVLFMNNVVCSGDPGEFLLDQTGTYTINVDGPTGGTGTYSITVLDVETADMFDIGLEETVSDGVPGEGAGNLEEAGAVDVYSLDIVAPVTVYFDELAGVCSIRWKCEAPDASIVFDDTNICSGDPGVFELTQTGTYTITVFSNSGGSGTYSFIVWDVNAPDTFVINIDEVVSDGVPGSGAGNIEEPGTIDIYTLAATAGDLVCFEELSGSCNIDWNCTAPDGSDVFIDSGLCTANPGKIQLDQTGDYTITVFGNNDTTGTYSFIANTGKIADIDGDCTVSTSDLLALLAAWGPCEKGEPCPADLDLDGEVAVGDLLQLLAAWD